MKKALFLAILGMLCHGGNVNAQGSYIGPQLGFFKSSDGDNTNIYAGGALRLKLSPGFGIEGSIGYRQEKFANDAITVKNWPIMVTGMLHIVPMVYGAVGFGWYNTTVDYDAEKLGIVLADDSETTRDVGWHFGGGVELPLGASNLLAADIRYVFLDYGFESIPGRDVNSNFYVITAGLFFGL